MKCVYGLCTNDSRYKYKEHMKNVRFFVFPQPDKNLIQCQRWIDCCGRNDLTVEKIKKWSFVCSRHFVSNEGPTFEHPYPIPFTKSKSETTKLWPNVKRNVYKEEPAAIASPSPNIVEGETIGGSNEGTPFETVLMQELQENSIKEEVKTNEISIKQETDPISDNESCKVSSNLNYCKEEPNELSIKQETDSISDNDSCNVFSNLNYCKQETNEISIKEEIDLIRNNQDPNVYSILKYFKEESNEICVKHEPVEESLNEMNQILTEGTGKITTETQTLIKTFNNTQVQTLTKNFVDECTQTDNTGYLALCPNCFPNLQ